MLNLRSIPTLREDLSENGLQQTSSTSLRFAASARTGFLGNIGESLGGNWQNENETNEDNARGPDDLEVLHINLKICSVSEIASLA